MDNAQKSRADMRTSIVARLQINCTSIHIHIHVLDYHRLHIVALPATLSKDLLLVRRPSIYLSTYFALAAALVPASTTLHSTLLPFYPPPPFTLAAIAQLPVALRP